VSSSNKNPRVDGAAEDHFSKAREVRHPGILLLIFSVTFASLAVHASEQLKPPTFLLSLEEALAYTEFAKRSDVSVIATFRQLRWS